MKSRKGTAEEMSILSVVPASETEIYLLISTEDVTGIGKIRKRLVTE